MIKKFNDGRDWFFQKRYGLFIHWGLYAVPAWHEQILWRKNLIRSEYEKLIHQFNPEKFNPDQWLDLAEEAGMEYLVFTVKHHEGFCLWDSKYTDFKVTNSPYRKDILEMLANACEKRKFPLSLYYSVVDWHHPNYPNQGRTHEINPQPEDSPHMEKYVEYLKNQIRELCTNYGTIHGIWWDMNVANHKDPSVHKLIHKLQPNAVINDRGFETGVMGQPENGDYTTPERSEPDAKTFNYPTEACQSVGSLSWGYKEDEDYFSSKYLIQSIDKVLSMGGNYLLNVGPDKEGVIPRKSSDILLEIGKWYKPSREALTASPATELTKNKNILLTKQGNCIYVHLNPDPACEAINLAPIDKMPISATLLNDGRKLDAVVDSETQHYIYAKNALRIRNIPVNEFHDTVMIIKLEFAD